MTEHAPQSEASIVEKRLASKIGREPRVREMAHRVLDQIKEPVRRESSAHAMIHIDDEGEEGGDEVAGAPKNAVWSVTVALVSWIAAFSIAWLNVVPGVGLVLLSGPALMAAALAALGLYYLFGGRLFGRSRK